MLLMHLSQGRRGMRISSIIDKSTTAEKFNNFFTNAVSKLLETVQQPVGTRELCSIRWQLYASEIVSTTSNGEFCI